jgi:hypothetical protein
MFKIGCNVKFKGEGGEITGRIIETKIILQNANKRTGNKFDRRCNQSAETIYIIRAGRDEYRRTAENLKAV